MSEGAKDHGERNWEQGISDPAWVTECYNHILEHLLKWKEGAEPLDDHLAGVLCGVGFLMVSEEEAPEVIAAMQEHV